MPWIAPCQAVHRAFRLDFCPFRMGALASFPFIGPCENNFSHKLNSDSASFCRTTIQAVQIRFIHCPEAIHMLYRSASQICLASRHLRSLSAAESAVFRGNSAQKIGGKRIASCRHRL
jgi:hypothetical protein